MKHYKTDFNPVTGAREDYFSDGDQMIIRNRHDVTDILESNKQQTAQTVDSRYGKEMMHHVADIPMAIYAKWLKEEGVDILANTPEANKFLKRKLNDPEFRYLKRTVKKV